MPEWDRKLLETPNPHLLQSYRWGQLQSAFGWAVWRRLVRTPTGPVPTTLLIGRCLGTGRRYGYVPKGPAVGADRLSSALESMQEIARLERLAFLRIEPEVAAGWEPPAGWFTAPAAQPEHTTIVDLRRDPQSIRSSFRPKTRYNLRLAERHGVQVSRSADISTFARLARQTSARHRIQLATEPYYRELSRVLDPDSVLYLAEHQGRALAGIMVVRFAGRSTYLFGASAREGRHLMPAYLLHWRAMLEAHNLGDAEYDLWGIPPDDRPNHPWAGLWQFKRGWNGRMYAYAGAFDFPLDVTSWRLHRALERIRGSLRRVQSRFIPAIHAGDT